MFMKIIDTVGELQREFQKMNRDNFSYEGYQGLLDLMEDLYGDEPQELDVIALDSDFTEMSTDEIIHDYGYLIDFDERQEDEDRDNLITELLHEIESDTIIRELSTDTYLIAMF